MIHSMTAYAIAEATVARSTLSCELRTVNHRYLEMNLRLPDDLRGVEPQLRERVAARLSRGKIDLCLRYSGEVNNASLRVDHARLAELAALSQSLGEFEHVRVEFTELLRFPGVLQREKLDLETQQNAVFKLLDQVLDALVAGREREGFKIDRALRDKLDGIELIVGQVHSWMPKIRLALRARLESRLAELGQLADPARLEQELVLQITRCDVDEELDRLTTHIAEIRRILSLAEPVGRRLDFLMQELNREANTLVSKSIDARTSNAAVELKVLIEQMREQIQNIE